MNIDFDLHDLFMANACLWDSPTEKWAMSEEDFIKALEQFKAEQEAKEEEQYRKLRKEVDELIKREGLTP